MRTNQLPAPRPLPPALSSPKGTKAKESDWCDRGERSEYEEKPSNASDHDIIIIIIISPVLSVVFM